MPKRKLSDLEANPSAPSAPSADPDKSTKKQPKPKQSKKAIQNQNRIALQTSRVSFKFDHDVQVISRALKLARGFEKQKMGRRGKKAKSEEETKALMRLEEEVKVLKNLDMDKVATKYLFKQLTKTKRIAESPAFIPFQESKKKISTDGPQTPAEANVLARLYKSNPVKNVFPGIMEGFRKILLLDLPQQSGKPGGSKAGQEKGATEQQDDGDSEDQDEDMEDAESGDSDDDFAKLDSRLGSSSESDSGSEDDDDAMRITPSPSPPPERQQKKTKPTPVTSTTFLPSLAMGGYVSGSDSEDDGQGQEQPQRKNRMGQQARRALWEKKYGAGANHVRTQQQQEQRESRDSGWDVRKGATGANSQAVNWKGGSRQHGRQDRDQGQRPAKAKPEDDKSLHPSWEAARKAKEQQKATMAFSGKKVTFD